MKNMLDYSTGVVPNEFAMQGIYRNIEMILDNEPAGELRNEMLTTWREWKLVNLKFGRLMRQQDERMFGSRKVTAEAEEKTMATAEQERKERVMIENHVETPANKLHDIATMLRLAERRQMSADEWLKLSRVVRHALKDAQEQLCGECKHGDLMPLDTRKAALQRAIALLSF
jgi:hypothetical protein